MIDHPIIRAVIIACLTAAVIGIWKLYIWPLPGKLRALNAKLRAHLAQTISDVVRAEVKDIKAELHPNGGSSLRDAIDRLTAGQADLAQSLVVLDRQNRAMLGFHDENRGWFFTDANGSLTWLSAQVLRWVGRSMGEVIGDRWHSIIWPDMREEVFRWWRDTSAVGSYGDMEQAYIAHDGSRIRVQIFASPVYDERNANKLLGYVGTITRLDKINADRT